VRWVGRILFCLGCSRIPQNACAVCRMAEEEEVAGRGDGVPEQRCGLQAAPQLDGEEFVIASPWYDARVQ